MRSIIPYKTGFNEEITFGVEIEFLAPVSILQGENLYFSRNGRNAVASDCFKFLANILERRSKKHVNYDTYDNYDHWQLKYDGSVSGGYDLNYVGGLELVSPVLHGKKGINQLKRMYKVLRGLGCTVNSTCGTHVHFGARSFGIEQENESCFIKKILDAYLEYESVIDRFVDSRRNQDNQYCLSWAKRINILYEYYKICNSNHDKFFDGISENNDDGKWRADHWFTSRYYKINFYNFLNNLANKRTVEIRQLQGTLDDELVCSWILLNQCLIHRALVQKIEDRTRKRKIEDLFNYLKWNKSKRRTFLTRSIELFEEQYKINLQG